MTEPAGELDLGKTTALPSATRISPVGWPRRPPEFTCMAAPWTVAGEIRNLSLLRGIQPADLSSWIDRLHRAGIIVDRHNSPNLFGQLGQALRRPIDTVLCSVLDVDPQASLNCTLAARYPLETVAGVTVIGRVTAARRAALITDARVPSGWFTTLRRAANETGIRIGPIVNDYPQADPTLMLYTLLNRRLRPGRLPTDQGVVLIDAAAAVAIGRYALLGAQMLQSPIVLRDHGLQQSHYLVAPIGTSLGEVARHAGVPVDGRILRSGDLLRDEAVAPDAVIGGGELLYHSAVPAPPLNPSPCIRCGWCTDACPTRVQPATILDASQHMDLELAESAGLEACIDCGVCAYLCPSQLPLLIGIRKMKQAQRDVHLQPG